MFSCMVKTFLKNIWRQFLFPRSEHLLVSSATLLCKTQNILTFSMLVYYNTNSFFSKTFLTYVLTLLVCSSSLIIKVLSELYFEVSLFHVASKFNYFQMQFLQKNYLGIESVFPDMITLSVDVTSSSSETVQTVYTYSNCMINQLLYY